MQVADGGRGSSEFDTAGLEGGCSVRIVFSFPIAKTTRRREVVDDIEILRRAHPASNSMVGGSRVTGTTREVEHADVLVAGEDFGDDAPWDQLPHPSAVPAGMRAPPQWSRIVCAAVFRPFLAHALPQSAQIPTHMPECCLCTRPKSAQLIFGLPTGLRTDPSRLIRKPGIPFAISLNLPSAAGLCGEL